VVQREPLTEADPESAQDERSVRPLPHGVEVRKLGAVARRLRVQRITELVIADGSELAPVQRRQEPEREIIRRMQLGLRVGGGKVRIRCTEPTAQVHRAVEWNAGLHVTNAKKGGDLSEGLRR